MNEPSEISNPLEACPQQEKMAIRHLTGGTEDKEDVNMCKCQRTKMDYLLCNSELPARFDFRS